MASVCLSDPMSLLEIAKLRLLPRGQHRRRLPIGIGRGLVMHIDFAHETRIYLGLYERELNRHIASICKRGVKSFDVGGQHGYDALLFAKLTRAQVASFEADARACERMSETFALNPKLKPLVRTVHAFVGDAPGEVRLDDFAASPGGFVPDLVKLDIEGGEVAALRSASALLRRHRPRLIVEVHSQEAEAECGDLLLSHGYRPTVVSQRRRFQEHRPIEHNRWLIA